MIEDRHLAVAADELCQTSAGRALQTRTERAETGYFEGVNRLAKSLDSDRPQGPEGEVSIAQLARGLRNRDRTERRNRLHPRGQVDDMSDGGVLRMPVASGNRADHHLASVDPDPAMQRITALRDEFCRIAPQLILHSERGIKRTLRMVLDSDRRAEQGENAVAGRLHDVPFIAPGRIDH